MTWADKMMVDHVMLSAPPDASVAYPLDFLNESYE
jgi:hypothetical protein